MNQEGRSSKLYNQDDVHEKFDKRTELVFDTLREKLKTTTEAPDKSDLEIQLEKSDLHLEELIQFGNELVNNVKGSGEQYELLQTQKKNAKEIELEKEIRKGAELSLSQFDEIKKKWTEINNLKQPMAIDEAMQKQRENIANLMESKDKLIARCQQALKKINSKYYDDLDKQSEDICFLVERVDHQIKLLRKSYKASIADLQNTIGMEREKVLQTAREKWNVVYEHLTDNEERRLEMVREKQNFYAKELANIRNKQEEITRNTKIRLEKDAEILELEIRKTQANILMNSEKIDYNYQVLQKRNEENIIINNQQKRRVAKLSESIVALKKKIIELKESNKQSMEKLKVDIQKLHANVTDLQTKSQCFQKNNTVKLAKIWNINFQEVKQLVTRVFEIDRILYEQQLGCKWVQPNFDLEKLDYMKEKHQENADTHEGKTTKPLSNATCQKHLHDILHKISDRAGFLVEERVLEILSPYTEDDQCLVKIESIFSALNIRNITVVESLIKHFEPYSWCPNCSTGVPEHILKSLYSLKRNSNTTDKDKDNSQNNTTTVNSADVVCTNHILCMEPTLVLTALNEFVSKEINNPDKSVEISRKLSDKTQLNLLLLDDEHITSYWQQFSSYMSKEQQTIWKSIEHGLNHYLEVLKKRAQIDSECVFLQNQNAELKYLLHKL